MRKIPLAVALMLLTISSAYSQVPTSDLPGNFPWNPGMMSRGGVPNITNTCATLSPSGGDDTVAIQNAINACSSGVVMLGVGTFKIGTNLNATYTFLTIPSNVVLRGAGAGSTILSKTNGARGRLSSFVPGTTIHTPVDPSTYTYDAEPIVVVGPWRFPGPGPSDAQSLTADGQQGSHCITVANASLFIPGQFALLDENSGPSNTTPAGGGWFPTPTNYPAQDIWGGDRVRWAMHYPIMPYEDAANSNLNCGPYDTTPCTPPDVMSWFSRTGRANSEIKEIASVSGNKVTFTSPLSMPYRVADKAQLVPFTANGNGGASAIQVTNAGVESLTLTGGGDGNLRFTSAAYSWAKNIESTNSLGDAVSFDNSFRVELRDSYIHTGSWPEPGGAGYLISVASGSSELLIENNILIDDCKEMVFRSSGAGSVVGYNYADDSWDFTSPTWVEVGLNASHMAGSHHVLFEGNYSQNFDSDRTHGNAIYMTVFRNWLSGKRHDFTDDATFGNVRTVGLGMGSWWDSFIGNVLGRLGQMSGWQYTDPAMGCDANGNNCTGNNANWNDAEIWKLGYDDSAWGSNPDLQVLSTVIRDGNYDFLTNSQRWHNTPSGFAIPNSLYLSSSPAFFGVCPWPWVDPSTGTIHTLPAKARFDAGTSNSPAPCKCP